MSKFDEQLSRMKALYTYGTVNEDNKKSNNSTLEFHKTAADGKEYGIIKECSHYYIKMTNPGKETIAESYQYIGGFNNKSKYEYDSYANALKNLELKLSSINEAHESKVDITTLDPFKKEDLVLEATDAMKNEIARQRQIMYNAAMLMNESSEYALSRRDDTVMYNGKNPEAPTGKRGDEGGKEAKANPEFKGSKTKGVKVDGGIPQAKTVKESCEGGSCDTDFDEGLGKGKDPKSVGWNIEGQQNVNEEADEKFSEGLPSNAGTGEAKPEEPFNKGVNEAYELYGDNGEVESSLPDEVNIEGINEEDEDDDFSAFEDDAEGEDIVDGDADEDVVAMDDEEPIDADAEGDELVDDEFPAVEDGEELGAEIEDEPMGGDDDLVAQIADLKAQLAALEAKVNGGEEDIEGEPTEEEPVDDELGDNLDGEEDIEDVDLSDEDNADDFESDEFEDEGDLEEGCCNEYCDDDDDDDVVSRFCKQTDKMAPGWNKPNKRAMAAAQKDSDDEDLNESKNAVMKQIVESVVKSILKEDQLHDFGKHPGYRKKPMELPATGSDNTEHGRDWNDDSVHNEQPFGEKIGNGDPFTQLVNAVTKDVKYQLTKGAPIEGKKKVN